MPNALRLEPGTYHALPSGPQILRWHDAHTPGATVGVSEGDITNIHRPLVIETVGYVLRDDMDGVTIASERCSDGDYRSVTFVPRVLIQSLQPAIPHKKRTQKKAPTLTSGEPGPATTP